MKKMLFLSLFIALPFLIAACGGPSGATPDESGELVILQIDEEGGMRFEPGDVVLKAGDRVRIVLENRGEKNHEFMIGRDVIRMEDGAANGFEVDFFEGIEDMVSVDLGEGAMLMIDGQTVGMDMAMGEEMAMGEDEETMAMGEEEESMAMGEEGEAMGMEEEEQTADEGMDHMGWMVMNNVGSGTTVIEFTVPADRVGEWEMGCFEDDGAHYDDGMRGTLTIVEP